MTEAVLAWTRVLDDVEARVAACKELLTAPLDELPDVAPFVVPDGLPPLPPELGPRAQAAAAASGEVERALLRRREQARQELALVDGVRLPSARTLDARA